MSTPQTEEYLQARIESCRLLGLNADDLSPHETIRADLLTVLRLWLDNSQTTLLGGGTADAGKLLSVAEALTKFIPEPEHNNHRTDPRETMWQTYKAMRDRGELAEKQMEPSLRAENERLRAENALLKAGATGGGENASAPAEPASPTPLPPNVAVLSRSSSKNAPTATPAPNDVGERIPRVAAPSSPTAEERAEALARANSEVPQHVRDTRPQNEPWRPYVEGSAFHDRWSNRNF